MENIKGICDFGEITVSKSNRKDFLFRLLHKNKYSGKFHQASNLYSLNKLNKLDIVVSNW